MFSKHKKYGNILYIILLLKWGDSYDGHGEMYYDYNHGPSYKHHDTYHEPAYGKSADEPIGYQPELVYKPTPTYNR